MSQLPTGTAPRSGATVSVQLAPPFDEVRTNARRVLVRPSASTTFARVVDGATAVTRSDGGVTSVHVRPPSLLRASRLSCTSQSRSFVTRSAISDVTASRGGAASFSAVRVARTRHVRPRLVDAISRKRCSRFALRRSVIAYQVVPLRAIVRTSPLSPCCRRHDRQPFVDRARRRPRSTPTRMLAVPTTYGTPDGRPSRPQRANVAPPLLERDRIFGSVDEM